MAAIRTNTPATIGAMRRRLTIQQAVRTSDGAGGYTTTWTAVCQVWGALAKPTYTEVLLGQQVGERVTLAYLIRYQPSVAISAGMRVVDYDSTGAGGKTYTIVEASDVDGTARQMRLTVQQVAP